MRWPLSSRFRHLGNPQGQVLVMVALASVALTGFVALSTDIGNYMRERQRLQHALDAGALAGAQFLPADGDQARRHALAFLENNNDDTLGDLSTPRITFGCLVSASSNDPLVANSAEVNGLCNQYEDDLASFRCLSNGRCYRDCEFVQNGDGCNTIRVAAEKTVGMFLAPVVSTIDSLRADLESHACRGGCGPPPDIAMLMVIDTSPTMSERNKLDEAKEGAVSILTGGFLVDEIHQVALATTSRSPFIQQDFSDLYREVLAPAVERLTTRPGTNFAGPINEAIDRFDDPRFAGARKQLILLTDGAPNLPTAGPCGQARAAAQRAKDADIRIFLIHYKSVIRQCPDGGQEAKDFLAGLATRPSLADRIDCDGEDGENTDEDDYFCEADGNDLIDIFRTIITRILNDVGPGSRLADLSGFLN